MPERLSRALLERRRTLIGTYVMRPGEAFPMRVDWPYGGGSRILEFYAPVPMDAAVIGRDYYRRWAESLPRIVGALDRSARIPWLRQWARDFRGSPTVLLFYLLRHDVTPLYEVDPRRAIPYPQFRDALATPDDRAVFHIFTPTTDAFAESVDEKLLHIERMKDLHDTVMWPMFRGLLIIERELALLIVGGQAIRLGAWAINWARNTHAVVSALRNALAVVQRLESAPSILAMADELFAAIKALGRGLLILLDIVGTHDVLLEIIPELTKLERRLANDIAALLGLQETGATAVSGWIVEDDPVEREFALRFASIMRVAG